MAWRTLTRGAGWTALAALLLLNLLAGVRLYSQETATLAQESPYAKMALFTKVLEHVRESYVDPQKAGYADLLNGALRGMLQSLDPHSQFLDPEMYRDMKDDTEGQFGGLGIVISTRDGVLTIVAPMEDTPGYRAGLLPGDVILEIDGKTTEGLSAADCKKRLRGAPGTKVVLKIVRLKTQAVKTLELVRAEIDVASVKDARLLEDGLGYLRITQFNEPTAGKLQAALDSLLRQGMRGLVVDLRNNPGGLLSSAIEVSQKFLPRGKLVVYTQGRTKSQRQQFLARGRYHYDRDRLPMVILVNEFSASASEIMAGALQDHRRAILVGEKTYGKGSVQSILPLEDGSAIKLTTAKYYTPSERVIHEHGIEPDIVVPMSAEDLRRIELRRSRPPNAAPEEGAEEGGSAVDVQLERAVDVLKGVMLFEGRNGRRA